MSEDNIDALIKQHRVGRSTRVRTNKIPNSFLTKTPSQSNNIEAESESKSPLKTNSIKWKDIENVDKIISEHEGIDEQLSNNSKTSTSISVSANKQQGILNYINNLLKNNFIK